MMNADLKLSVKCLERDVFGKLINWTKNGVELVRVIETLKSIQECGFSVRLHFVARTFYFRLVDALAAYLENKATNQDN